MSTAWARFLFTLDAFLGHFGVDSGDFSNLATNKNDPNVIQRFMHRLWAALGRLWAALGRQKAALGRQRHPGKCMQVAKMRHAGGMQVIKMLGW